MTSRGRMAVLFVATCVVDCGGRSGTQPTGTPALSSISPSSGPNGIQVTLRGTNFTRANTISFSNLDRSFAVDSPATSGDGTSLQFRVSSCPSYAPQCPGFFIFPGIYNVSVTTADGGSNQLVFTVTGP